jgi:hypothetical protein
VFYDQAGSLRAPLEQKWGRVFRADEAGSHSGGEHPVPAPERLLPEGCIEKGGGIVTALFVAAPGVVDQQIEPSLLIPHLLEQAGHVLVDGVVAAYGDRATTALPDERDGLL